MYKAAYETTIGRLTHWTANKQPTAEDRIISDAHRAYSDLIFEQAWYEFDFSHWLGKVWLEPDFFGDNFIRKLERKLFFSLEFGFKHLYAGAIKYAAQSSYEASDGNIYMIATSHIPLEASNLYGAKILASKEQQYLLSVPRWGSFSENIPKLANAGVTFNDISGNNAIAVSFITNKQREFIPSLGKLLFKSRQVSQPKVKRVVYLVPVDTLTPFINQLDRNGHQIEHIFDY